MHGPWVTGIQLKAILDPREQCPTEENGGKWQHKKFQEIIHDKFVLYQCDVYRWLDTVAFVGMVSLYRDFTLY